MKLTEIRLVQASQQQAAGQGTKNHAKAFLGHQATSFFKNADDVEHLTRFSGHKLSVKA